ncbi:MAG: flagellar basal body protein [Desulforhopalus sp.]|nr:flagellar basal body protein [Desulforhopalus sp.]
MMISAYSSALTALQAFGTKVQSGANNIANANTDGFRKTRVTMAEQQPQGVRATVDQVNTPGASVFQETSGGPDLVELSNVEMSSEIPEMSLSSQFYKANLKTIETVNDMTGTLLDIQS